MRGWTSMARRDSDSSGRWLLAVVHGGQLNIKPMLLRLEESPRAGSKSSQTGRNWRGECVGVAAVTAMADMHTPSADVNTELHEGEALAVGHRKDLNTKNSAYRTSGGTAKHT